MPPKVRITKEDIVNTAVDIVRRDGTQALNARNIASALNCSTQPIFSNFATMEELHKGVVTSAYELYLSFLREDAQSGKYPVYKAFGMAYIRFAKEEQELFKMLFMCDRKGEELKPTADRDASIEIIMNSNGITREKAELIHLEMWVCVHGIATILATSYLSLERELISDILTDVYQGIRARHLQKEEQQ